MGTRLLFNSLEFLFLFLPATLVLYYVARTYVGHHVAIWLLTLASLVFYGWWNVSYIPLLLGSVMVNFVLGHVIQNRGSQPWLAIGIVFNLGLIGLYKYAGFFVSNVNAVSGAGLPVPELALPLAISFFTFQQISYLVDVAQSKARSGKLVNHALFVTFFPQLIAGPIVRHDQIADQYADAERKDDLSLNIGIGLSIFAFGLAKKVLLADNLEPLHRVVSTWRHAVVISACGRPGPRPSPTPSRSSSTSPAIPTWRWAWPACSVSTCRQLQRALSRDLGGRVLASLAHHAVAFPARLSLHPAGR